MKHLGLRAMLAGEIAILLASAVALTFAAQKPDFSGTYSLRQRVGKPIGPPTSKVFVVQNGDSIEITRAQEHSKKEVRSRLPLNGDEGNYTNPDGISGRGKARLKRAELLLDSTVDNSPRPGAPAVATHTHERWTLSPDSKLLTIQYDVDLHVGLSNAVKQSWTEQYVRTRH